MKYGVASSRWSAIIALVAGSVAAISCSSPSVVGPVTENPDPPKRANIELVSSPPGLYAFATWLDASSLAVQYKPGLRGILTTEIWKLSLNGLTFEKIELPNHPSCGPDGQNGFESPHRLPDGRIGYIVSCRPADDLFNIKLYLMAYRLTTGEVEQLLPYPFPQNSIGTGGFVWNPGMSRGLMGDGKVIIREQLSEYSREGWQPLDVGLVQAYGPSWSPDGMQVAFLGSTKEGSPLTFVDYELYLMDPDGKDVRAVLRGFHDSSGVAWSPDGRWLVFPATFGEREGDQQGLWLFDLETEELRQITEGVFGLPRWSPDGERLAVVQFLGSVDDREDRVAIVEIGSLLVH